MNFEQEQAEYRKQLEEVTERLIELENAFIKYPKLKFSPNGGIGNVQEEYLKMILQQKYGDFSTSGDSVFMLEYKLCIHRQRDLEIKLKESKTDRNILKTLNYIDGIIPEHVSGRVYKVGDGCGTFCLWFIIIDAIGLFLWYLISGGN